MVVVWGKKNGSHNAWEQYILIFQWLIWCMRGRISSNALPTWCGWSNILTVLTINYGSISTSKWQVLTTCPRTHDNWLMKWSSICQMRLGPVARIGPTDQIGCIWLWCWQKWFAWIQIIDVNLDDIIHKEEMWNFFHGSTSENNYYLIWLLGVQELVLTFAA